MPKRKERKPRKRTLPGKKKYHYPNPNTSTGRQRIDRLKALAELRKVDKLRLAECAALLEFSNLEVRELNAQVIWLLRNEPRFMPELKGQKVREHWAEEVHKSRERGTGNPEKLKLLKKKPLMPRNREARRKLRRYHAIQMAMSELFSQQEIGLMVGRDRSAVNMFFSMGGEDIEKVRKRLERGEDVYNPSKRPRTVRNLYPERWLKLPRKKVFPRGPLIERMETFYRDILGTYYDPAVLPLVVKRTEKLMGNPEFFKGGTQYETFEVRKRIAQELMQNYTHIEGYYRRRYTPASRESLEDMLKKVYEGLENPKIRANQYLWDVWKIRRKVLEELLGKRDG